MKNNICFICARLGSKGIPDKNIKLMNGAPLISYTIKQAIDSKIFSLIAVSSDSEKILKVAKAYGANLLIKRPKKLSNNLVGKIDVIKTCFKKGRKNNQ